jgi:hypothetical protein
MLFGTVISAFGLRVTVMLRVPPINFKSSKCACDYLRNSRKTEHGAKQFLTGLVERAAPFALLRTLH